MAGAGVNHGFGSGSNDRDSVPARRRDIIATVVVAGYSDLAAGRGPGPLQMEAYKMALPVLTQIGPTPNVSLFAAEPIVIRRYWAPVIDHAAFALFTNGNAQVALGILEGNPQSDSSVQIPAVARYSALHSQGKLDEMTLTEAIALADALITESIRIGGRALGIGGQIDIAVITPKEGFHWVPDHEPDRKRPHPPSNTPRH